MSWAYCAMAAVHVWLGRTCAVANCQQQQRQHGAHAGCADGSNMILYLAFILDDTVGEWHKVRDLFLCITRQIGGIWKLRPAYSPEKPNLGQNRWCFVPCDLEIWWMTLENNRASLLCCFKLCATFHSHWWIETGVTVRKRPIWVKFDDF